MTHRIEPYEHYVANDSIVWPFNIKEDGSAKDLSNATVSYYILSERQDNDGDALVDDSDADVTVEIQPGGETGQIRVTIQKNVLDYPGRHLWHRLQVEDSSGGRKTFGGPFPVNRT